MGDRIKELEERVKRLEDALFPPPKPAQWPTEWIMPLAKPRCPTCGVDWSGPMGYCCQHMDCPIPRAT